MGARSSQKGGAWERTFAKQLSHWWTGGADQYVFSRRSASGGARRDKIGLSGNGGDIQADKPDGDALLSHVSFELKFYVGLGNELWKWIAAPYGKSQINRFLDQAIADAGVNNRAFVLVLKTNNRRPLLVCYPDCPLLKVFHDNVKLKRKVPGVLRTRLEALTCLLYGQLVLIPLDYLFDRPVDRAIFSSESVRKVQR